MKKEIYLNIDFPFISKSTPGSSAEVHLALCKRLFVWQYFHQIAQIFDCSLVVNRSSWPEEVVLEFPDTKFVDDFYLKDKEYHLLDVETLTKKIDHVIENCLSCEDLKNPTLDKNSFLPGSGGGDLSPEDSFLSKIFYSKIIVYVDNILQKYETDYILKGNRIWFKKLIEKGSKCSIFYYKDSYKKIKTLELPEIVEDGLTIDKLYPEKFSVFDDISDLFDNVKWKFQLSLTKPGFIQTAHLALKPWVTSNSSLFNIDNKEYDCLRFDAHNLYDTIINKTYDKLVDFINIHSDCLKTCGMYHDIRMIKIKDKKLNQFFLDNFSKVVGTQIRRGLYTKLNKTYLDDLKQYVDPDNIKKYYTYLNNISIYGHLTIEPDDYYYEMIDKIINEDPNKKIYLSHDVPKIFINHFLEKYPNNIITKHDYLNEYLAYFSEYDIENDDNSKLSVKHYKLPFKKAIIDLLDFLALCNSELLIGRKLKTNRPWSSWLFFTRDWNGKNII
jgi:hypothetical protein